MSSVAKLGGGGVRPQNPPPEEVEKCLSEMKGLKRVRFRNMTRKLLRDPLLWLRVGHSTDELANERLNAVFDRLAPRLELCDANAENLLRRNRLCNESLKCEGRIEALKAFFSATHDKKDGDLRAVLFPYLPNAVREKVLAHEVSVTKQGVSGLGSVHRGIVTDLYDCQDGGWEGYIASITEKSAVYRFTSTSCVCAFPVCIGSTVEFCLSTRIPGSVADSSAKAIEYIPGTLPDGYAADYLQCLEDQAPSVCLDRIMKLPGPLRAILHEPDLHIPHMSKILAVLHCISSVANEYFSRVAKKLGIHESSFLGSLPKTLCMQQSTPDATRGSVVQFLRLVSVCIHTCPDIAYEMSSVIQGCARLATSFGEEFSLEGPNLGKAIIHACSVVRGAESLQEPLTEDNNNAPSLQDPLLWITHVFGKAVANSLRKHIPGTLLREDESGVITRRKLENIIASVAPTGSEDKMPTKVLTELHLPQFQSISSNEHGQLTQKMGIVTDLYPNREGYIVLASGKGCHRRTQRVFKLRPATTTEVVSSIHLGDIVQFIVSSSSPGTVERVVKIKQYCPEALDVTFASDYLSQNEGLMNRFENEAAMKAILNASHVYTSPDVCAKLISTACSALSDFIAASIKKKMLALLKSSSFILDIIQIAPEEVTKSMKVLEKYLEHFPNEVCVLVPALESMVDVLQKQDKPLELAAFVSFLSSSTCLLPHSVEIARQPWQTVPTLLTEEEWKAGAVANTDYLPCVKDRYTSVHEYGRTYFLLLRADCYGDLATSIRRLREPTASNSKATDEAVVVYDATITAFSNYSAGHKLVYHFTIKTQPQSSENVPSDAPFLKAGNLLCLSVGGRFKDDIVWATINRVFRYIHVEENGTKQCEVMVELCTESNTLSDEEAMLSLNNSGNVVALKSPAYFRAYQPVLDALKQMDMEKIHFLPDLLNPGKEPQAFLELINDSTLVTDLDGLYKQEAEGVPVVMTVGELRERLSDTEQHTDFCLPKFQRIAMERALSQALSLIQGPPGTGKSYIGMQLLRLFLSMKNSSGQPILDNKPALVIAYKNRALDLFIRMCTSFCPLERIVRIGHLSKDNEEELKCTLLNEKVKSGLDRNRTVELQAAMEHQYERVKMAKIALVATVEMAGLNECLDHITPEWLQSLILDQGSVSAVSGVAARVRDDPESCLDLLQRAQMGERDRQERQEIEGTLSRSWSKWVEGIRWESHDPQDPVPGTSGPLQYDSDSEWDSREYEKYYDNTLQERNNAVETLTSVYAGFEDGPVEVSNVWALSPDDRRRMIRAAVRERYESAMDDLKDSIRQYNMIREIYEKRREEKAVEILKKAKVVAMTTTGAAINQRLLNQLEAPVVFVEEAAEILESNLLAVLTPYVKHMVLIGDQKQLKPTVAWNKLASDRYKFDVSLFVRLIRNKYPHTLLLRQSRMHPSLMPLYGYHYQRAIRSVDKTNDLVHPKCMGKNFFWWSYSGANETRREKGYMMNTYEVDMVVSLCCWLVCNRVESGKIAVLTPYRGQLEEIKKSLEDKANNYRNMPRVLVDIDVYTVDEYQGHECDVVILSLVRSNTMGKIGFLKSPNRLVVGTSRQKCALYIVGNHTFLEKNSPVLWKKFLTECRPGSIGTDLPIVVGTSPVECPSSSELDERVQMALEVAANNAEGDKANETDFDPLTAGLQSAVGTLSPSVRAHKSGPSTPTSIRALSGPGMPASVRSQSAVSTPAAVRSQSAVSTPAAVRSQSAVSTPASVRSQSAVSTPATVRSQSAVSTPAAVRSQSAVSTPAAVRSQSAVSTPAAVRSQSAVSTPAAVRSQSAVSTPAAVRSQSAVSTPASHSQSSPASRSARSKSVDSTPPSAPFRARFESTPAFENTQNVVASCSPGHQPHLLPLTEPQPSRSACRQQSSPPALDPTLMAGDTPVLGENDEPVSSSSATWDFRQCILNLKDTAAATNWKFIGRRLGISDGDIGAIDKNYSSDMKEMFYQMMVKWKSMKGERATRERLIEVLKEEKMNQIAEELEKDEVS